MRIDTLIVGLVCLLLGFLGGYFYDKSAPAPTPAPVAQQGAPADAGPGVNRQQQIAELEKLVAAEPQNRPAWVALGNGYFDTDQPMKAAEAYDQALALEPDDANVLVDQGVMYRRLGWFDKAIANFDKALAVEPTHKNALYNKGIVYRYDLKDFAKAAATWEQLLPLLPPGPRTEELRAQVEFLKTHPPTPEKP